MEKTIYEYLEEILESPASEVLTGYQKQAIDACAELFSFCDYTHLWELARTERDQCLMVPLCKIGDTVYQTDGVRIYESEINRIIYDTINFAFDERAIGKTVFLSRESAEMACKAWDK